MQVGCHFGFVCAAKELSANIGLHAGLRALRTLGATSQALHAGTQQALGLVESKRPLFVCVCGGRAGSKTLDSLRAFGILDGSWHPLPAMQQPRLGAVAGVLGGCVYVCGGGTVLREAERSSVECFKPQSLSWTMTSSMLVPRMHAGAAVISGALFVCGGCCNAAGSSSETSVEYLGPLQECDAWRLAAPLPVGRSHHAVAKLRDSLFVCGGLDDDGDVLGTVVSLRIMQAPGESSWSRAPPLLTARMMAAAAATSQVLVLCGGLSSSDEVLSSVECYDAATQCWSYMPSMSTPRFGAVVVSAARSIFVFGGRSDNGFSGPRRGGIALRTAEALSLHTTTHSWLPLPPLSDGVEQASAAVLAPG